MIGYIPAFCAHIFLSLFLENDYFFFISVPFNT